MTPHRERERGQVLILGVMALIVLLLAVFFLLDLHQVIRQKVKSQTAVDAAALVGALWQKHTLNAVGELNLVKAASVLLSDELFRDGSFPNVSADSLLRAETKAEFDEVNLNQRYGILKAAAATLSQMQYRLLFIGPMIGFAAAQQAAMNNGAPPNDEFGEAVLEQYRMLEGSSSRGSLYARYNENEFLQKHLFGYQWFLSYRSLLSDILRSENGVYQSIAVLPNAKLMGTPYLRSRSTPNFASELSTYSFYESVSTDYWCRLMNFLDKYKEVTSAPWWGDLYVELDDSFLGESEYLPVGVELRTADSAIYDNELRQLFDAESNPDEKKITNNLSGIKDENGLIRDWSDPVYDSKGKRITTSSDQDGKLSPLPVIDWAYYKSSWEEYDQDVTAEWKEYLRRDFRSEAAYASGAVSRMDISYQPSLLTGALGSAREGISGTERGYLTTGLDQGGTFFRSNALVRDSFRRTRRVQDRMSAKTSVIHSFCVAKPFGSVEISGTPVPPCRIRVVLPVFEQTALIPVDLEDPGINPLFYYDWYLFILYYMPELAKVKSPDDMPEDMKMKFSWQHGVLKKITPEWVQSGLDWLDTPHIYTVRGENDVLIEKVWTQREECNRPSKTFSLRGGSGGGSGGYHRVEESSGAPKSSKHRH